jgi:hypothetical protein
MPSMYRQGKSAGSTWDMAFAPTTRVVLRKVNRDKVRSDSGISHGAKGQAKSPAIVN